LSKPKVEDILCHKCGKPLTGSSIVTACRDVTLGARIVVHCGNCGYYNRFQLKE